MKRLALLIATLLIAFNTWAQTTGTVEGLVYDEDGYPIDLANVGLVGTTIGTRTNKGGTFRLEIPTDRAYVITVTYLGFKPFRQSVKLEPGTEKKLRIAMERKTTDIREFEKKEERNRDQAGVISLNAKQVQQMPSTIGGIEALLKIFVGTNNELTSQYNVRGGNFDENIVYVNDFEVYRPFLIRSGQQEGLSFINSDMVQSVSFSTGGFQAKYGDKMSSVLDVKYKTPTKFGGTVGLSLLGGSAEIEGCSNNHKVTYMVGVRQKSNSYLLSSQPTKGLYYPSFTDAQALVTYQPTENWKFELLGNYARNRFTFQPEERTTSFGLVNKAYQLQMLYNGNEIDQFDSRFGGVSATYIPTEKLSLKLLASGFQTNEEEAYDIDGEYLLGELESDPSKNNFGKIRYSLGTGSIQNYARNYLTATMLNFGHKGVLDLRKHYLQWGINLEHVQINDKLLEWERRDSAGFSQPYTGFAPEMLRSLNTHTDLNYTRITAFIQDNIIFNDSLGITLNGGVRFNYSLLNHEVLVSPRLQFSWKLPGKNDIVLRAATGLYQQPPFYREMRNLQGMVNTDLLAQKSFHFVLGTDYNFKVWNRPFKFTTEAYYKRLWDLVPYEYDNVRIRYFGENNSVGYAIGGEARLYGDLVKDAESWVSLGIMKTMENLKDDYYYIYYNAEGQDIRNVIYGGDRTPADSSIRYPGWLPRPTDSRVNFGLFFQDYLPRNKNFKAHLSLLYSTGLPFGNADGNRYNDNYRLPDYKRVDIGFSALLLDGARKERPRYSYFSQIESIWASLEVFNLLGIQNTLSYTWIQDQMTGRSYAVPNRLTARLLNVKLVVKF